MNICRMNCEVNHEEYKKSEFSKCPFCNKILEESKSTETKYCDFDLKIQKIQVN